MKQFAVYKTESSRNIDWCGQSTRWVAHAYDDKNELHVESGLTKAEAIANLEKSIGELVNEHTS